MDDTRRVDEHGAVATIIERAGAEVPRNQVRAEEHEFVRLLATANFSDYVFGLGWTSYAIRHVEMHADFLPGGEKFSDALSVFPRQNCLGQQFELAIGRDIVAIEQEIGPRGHP